MTHTFILKSFLAYRNNTTPTTIYLALDEAKNPVIIKEITVSSQSDRSQVEREIGCLLRLNKLRLFRFDGDVDLPRYLFNKKKCTYTIVFDAYTGIGLDTFLELNMGTLSPQEILSLIYFKAKALKTLHNEIGIAHRDIKPDNYFVNIREASPNKLECTLELIDVGTGIQKDYAPNTYKMGHPAFSADEAQFDSDEIQNTHLSDRASLGYSILFMLNFFKITKFGRNPDSFDFEKVVPQKLIEEFKFDELCAKELATIIALLTKKDPEQRISLDDVCKRLTDLLGYIPNLDWILSKQNFGEMRLYEKEEQKQLHLEGMSSDKLLHHGYPVLGAMKQEQQRKQSLSDSRSSSFETKKGAYKSNSAECLNIDLDNPALMTAIRNFDEILIDLMKEISIKKQERNKPQSSAHTSLECITPTLLRKNSQPSLFSSKNEITLFSSENSANIKKQKQITTLEKAVKKLTNEILRFKEKLIQAESSTENFYSHIRGNCTKIINESIVSFDQSDNVYRLLDKLLFVVFDLSASNPNSTHSRSPHALTRTNSEDSNDNDSSNLPVLNASTLFNKLNELQKNQDSSYNQSIDDILTTNPLDSRKNSMSEEEGQGSSLFKIKE